MQFKSFHWLNHHSIYLPTQTPFFTLFLFLSKKQEKQETVSFVCPRPKCAPWLRLGENWVSRGNKTHIFPWGPVIKPNSAIISCSTNLLSVRKIFWGVFIFIFFQLFLFWGVFNKTIIPLALVGYEVVMQANSDVRAPARWLSAIS